MKKKSNRNVVQRCSILFTGRNITVISIKCATPCLREILSMYWISFLFFNNKWLQTKHNWWTKNRRVEKDITTIAMYQLPSIVLQNVSTCTDNAAWKPDTFCSGKKKSKSTNGFFKVCVAFVTILIFAFGSHFDEMRLITLIWKKVF